MVPRPGDLVEVTSRASVQFTTPFRFRVIRVHDWPTYAGWLWLDGYQLDARGDAVARRSIYVRAAGLVPVETPASTAGRATDRRSASRPSTSRPG